MASANLQNFDKRLRRVSRRHNKLSRGYVHTVNHDGLIVATPRRQRHDGGFPAKGLLILAVGVFLFKGFLYAQLGGATYNQRLAKLEAGTSIEQIGAFMMTADPVTLWTAEQIKYVLPK
ncbi:MAG: hypothetical protein ABJP33_15350 [Pseudoruegeria sp.]